MWQAIYPDAWYEPSLAQYGTWTIASGTLIDGNTPLAPFNTANNTMWTPNTARDTKTFGYSYADIEDYLPHTAQELSAKVIARVNQLYNPTGAFGPFYAPGSKRSSTLHPRRQWSIKVSIPNGALGMSFAVTIAVEDKMVGMMTVNFAAGPALTAAGPTPMTHAEIDLSNPLACHTLNTEDVAAVKEYLKQNLHVCIKKPVSLFSSPLSISPFFILSTDQPPTGLRRRIC